jgi:hypothetical protein
VTGVDVSKTPKRIENTTVLSNTTMVPKVVVAVVLPEIIVATVCPKE